MATITQAWHDRMATYLMNAARGDLMLGVSGDLHQRRVYDENGKELPRTVSIADEKLAVIGRQGWSLTRIGAQFILENCPPEPRADLRRLEQVAL